MNARPVIMSKKTLRVLFISAIMIMTSLAGCIESSEDSTDDSGQSDEYYGTIMTSTYHVQQLVSAVVGDTATVEMMSTSNIPVHDYNPTAIDIERLKSSDAFFYHGLELEPWVTGTLSSEGIPPSYMTHTMPSGEITLDYQTMLVNDLCDQLNNGDEVSNTLLSYEDQADQLEIHLEKGVQNLTFPAADTSHDGHDHDDHGDEDGHDDHGDEDGHDDHDDHDAHAAHAHAEAEKVINNPVNCPANTVISVFHLEEGEHTVEFETNWWARTSFDMAALPMMGGHAHHHHHGHGDGPFEWAGIFALDDASHTWSMQKVGGAYADPTMRLVLIPTATPDEPTMHSLEGGVEALIEGDCQIVKDGETMQNIASTGTCFELHVGEGDDSTFNMDTTGLAGLAIYAQHVPTEFERDQHYLKDSTGADIEPVAQEGGGDHGHHDSHGDEGGHDDHGDDDGHEGHGGHDGHEGHGDEAFEWAGIFALNDASHTWSMQKVGGAYADPSMRLVLIPTDTPDEATLHSLESGVEDLIEGDCQVVEDGETMQNIASTGTCFELHVGQGDDSTFNMDTTDMAGLAIYAQHVPTEFERDQHYLKDSAGTDIEPVAQEGGDGHGHHDGHGDEEEPYCHTPDHVNTDHSNREDCEAAGNIWMAGEPNDGTRGYLTIHVENEGDYGFAVPSDISVFVLMGDGHEGHDHGGHDDHDDHAGHSDEEGAHDDDAASDGTVSDSDSDGTIEADEDEEEFEYDPHSWLDPVAFKAQTQLVLNALIEVFPNGSETFTANADAFMAELDKVHLGYVGAFGPEGTCDNKTAAANHNAYSYITERYGVEFVTVHGLDPEGEPTAADVDEVISKINEDQISVLFIEEYTQASSVDVIVEATGVQVMYLYTMEKSPSDANDDYLSMLNKNLDNLKSGLGCAV